MKWAYPHPHPRLRNLKSIKRANQVSIIEINSRRSILMGVLIWWCRNVLLKKFRCRYKPLQKTSSSYCVDKCIQQPLEATHSSNSLTRAPCKVWLRTPLSSKCHISSTTDQIKSVKVWNLFSTETLQPTTSFRSPQTSFFRDQPSSIKYGTSHQFLHQATQIFRCRTFLPQPQWTTQRNKWILWGK